MQDSLLIQAPQEPLFQLLNDYKLRLRWDPFLKEMKFLGGAPEAAVGVRTWVRAWTGLTMEVEYTTLAAPEVVAMKMTKGPYCFTQFAGSWRLQSDESGAVRVTFRYSFTTRWRWLRWLLDPIIRQIFQRDVRARLRGLQRGAEREQLLAELPRRG